MISRIILVTRSSSLRLQCWMALSSHAKLVVVDDVGAVFERLRTDRAAIVIIDLAAPPGEVLEVVKRLIDAFPDTKVLALSRREETTEIADMFGAGVKGYCRSDIAPKLLRKAVKMIAEGEIWLERRLTAAVLAKLAVQGRAASSKCDAGGGSTLVQRLTPRELEIALLVAEGLCQKSITKRLVISENTVRNHLRKIFQKTGVTSRVQLALIVRAESV